MTTLHRIFGPSRDEIWRQLSSEIDGEYHAASFLHSARVEARHDQWVVTFDRYMVPIGKTFITYTRLRAPFRNPGDFRFSVYRKTFFSGLGKWFGMQDLEIGEQPFDDDFIIKSNDEEKVKRLFDGTRIRELISLQKDIQFGVRSDEGWFSAHYPEGVDELHFVALGVIKDKERLKQLFELFSETLDQLCRIGVADQQGVEL